MRAVGHRLAPRPQTRRRYCHRLPRRWWPSQRQCRDCAAASGTGHTARSGLSLSHTPPHPAGGAVPATVRTTLPGHCSRMSQSNCGRSSFVLIFKYHQVDLGEFATSAARPCRAQRRVLCVRVLALLRSPAPWTNQRITAVARQRGRCTRLTPLCSRQWGFPETLRACAWCRPMLSCQRACRP